jgi:hypothetical protein
LALIRGAFALWAFVFSSFAAVLGPSSAQAERAAKVRVEETSIVEAGDSPSEKAVVSELFSKPVTLTDTLPSWSSGAPR